MNFKSKKSMMKNMKSLMMSFNLLLRKRRLLLPRQRKTRSGDQGMLIVVTKGKKKVKPTTKKVNNIAIVTRCNLTIKSTRHSKHLE